MIQISAQVLPTTFSVQACDILVDFFLLHCRNGLGSFLAERYLAAVPSLEAMRSNSYAETVAHFRKEQQVLRPMNDMLQRFIRLMNHGRPEDKPLITGHVHPKILAASYVIVLHPDNTFEVRDELSVAVSAASESMILGFEYVVSEMCSGKGWASITRDGIGKEFPARMAAYLRTFRAWKTQDGARIAEKIKHSLRQLVCAHIPLRSSRNADLVQQLKDQIGKLKEKLGQIAGTCPCTCLPLFANDARPAMTSSAQMQAKLSSTRLSPSSMPCTPGV